MNTTGLLLSEIFKAAELILFRPWLTVINEIQSLWC